MSNGKIKEKLIQEFLEVPENETTSWKLCFVCDGK